MAATTPDVRPGGRSILERSPSARRADPMFHVLLVGLAGLILALIAFFFVYLITKAQPALSHQGIFSFLFTNDWNPSKAIYGAWPLVVGTLVTAAIALVIGVPIAVATALFITELAPRSSRPSNGSPTPSRSCP
jgi:ABC-type phosphate transport system permease subunit